MDQLASIGIEFDVDSFTHIIKRTQSFYDNMPLPLEPASSPFAKEPIYTANKPRRPWALGAICRDTNLVWLLAGSHARRPGMQRQSGGCRDAPPPFLQNTSERIHSSVRVRMRCEGLGLNDKGLWDCPALRDHWQLKKRRVTSGSPGEDEYIWAYVGPLRDCAERELAEEPLGPIEQRLLQMTAGEPNVFYDVKGAQRDL